VNCLVGELAVGELGVGELSVGEQTRTRSKVRLSNGHSLILTTDHHDMGIEMKDI
jgi:hypothetical protein